MDLQAILKRNSERLIKQEKDRAKQNSEKMNKEEEKMQKERSELFLQENKPKLSGDSKYIITFLGFVDKDLSKFKYSNNPTNSSEYRLYQLEEKTKNQPKPLCRFLFNVSDNSILFKWISKGKFSLDKAEKYDNLDEFVETKEPHKFLFKKSAKKSVKKSAKKSVKKSVKKSAKKSAKY